LFPSLSFGIIGVAFKMGRVIQEVETGVREDFSFLSAVLKEINDRFEFAYFAVWVLFGTAEVTRVRECQPYRYFFPRGRDYFVGSALPELFKGIAGGNVVDSDDVVATAVMSAVFLEALEAYVRYVEGRVLLVFVRHH
jgi:hypothetical protein